MIRTSSNTNDPNVIFAMQDGADFYWSHSPDVETFSMVETAPIPVSDWDLAAAGRARDWFVSEGAGAGRKVVWQ